VNAFAKRFNQLCIDNKITLRQISAETGKTIGYLSDVKYGRRIPPTDDVVKIIERMFGISDGSLSKLAKFVREAPKEFSYLMKTQPTFENLALTLLRAESELDEEELKKKLLKVQEIFEHREE
jgi:transcriptional regulator with XRE-family HTH domain